MSTTLELEAKMDKKFAELEAKVNALIAEKKPVVPVPAPVVQNPPAPVPVVPKVV
jgi:hypothetical protein